MQEFLLSLIAGRRDIPKRFAPLYEQLRGCGAIDTSGHTHKLHSAFMLARVQKPAISAKSAKSRRTPHAKAPILACNLADKSAKPIRVSGRVLGLEQGDIILLLTRSKTPRLIKLLTRPSSQLICLVKKRGNIIGIDCQSLEPIALPFSQKSLLELPKYCVLELERSSQKSKHSDGYSSNGARIGRILGSLLDPSIDEGFILAKHKRAAEFSSECLELAKSYESISNSMSHDKSSEIGAQQGRKDLRDKPFITIDPNDAKDHDDAIFWERDSHTLYVAIADVSEYVAPNTALDHAARERCFSLYFPHICYPMLPNALSQNLCSLRAREDKLALVWEIRLHKRTHEPLESKLYEALITPSANISYEQAQAILDASAKAPESRSEPESVCVDSSLDTQTSPNNQRGAFADVCLDNPLWLSEFAHIAQALKAKRLKSGFDFWTKDIAPVLDSASRLEAILEKSPSPSHALVEEAMLLANVLSAQALHTYMPNSHQAIYRTHEPPTQEKIYTLFHALSDAGYTIPKGDFHSQICELQRQANARENLAQDTRAGLMREHHAGESSDLNARYKLDIQIIRAQKEARYDTQPDGHFGLGFTAYTHFTSPIRRYSDLLAHRMLKTLMRDFPERTIVLKSARSAKPAEEAATPKTQKLLAYLLESTSAMIPMLNDKERDIARAEAEFRDRKYARFALALLESDKYEGYEKSANTPRGDLSQMDTRVLVRIIDERYPALGVVESSASFAESSTIKAPHTKKECAGVVRRFGLFGARVVIEHAEYELVRGGVYEAFISRVDLVGARIYAQIME